MLQRTLTIAVILPLFIAALYWLPNLAWALAIGALVFGGAVEWTRLARFTRGQSAVFLGVFLAGAGGLYMETGEARWIYALSVVFWCVAAPWVLKAKFRGAPFAAWMAAGWLVLLPAWLVLVRLQGQPEVLIALTAVAWIADTGAYIAGRAWGRRKLAPGISPNKTWEGAAGALIAVAVYAWAMHLTVFSQRLLWQIEAGFIAMMVLAVIGDLFESWLKRVAGVKDSGALLPGHGGVLDRIDSSVAALPLAALVFAPGLLAANPS